MKRLYLLIFLSIAFCKTQAQPSYLNKKHTDYNSIGACIKNDEGYLLATTTSTSTAQLLTFVQINLYGDTVWSKTIGDNPKGYVPQQILKGGAYNGHILLGTVYDSLNNSNPYQNHSHVFIVQIDSQYNVKNIELFGNSTYQDNFGKAVFSNDGSLLIVGSSPEGYASPFLMTLTLNNNHYELKTQKKITGPIPINIWAYYSSKNNSGINSLVFSQNTLLFAYLAAGPFDTYAGMAKIDTAGNVLWDKTYSNATYDHNNSGDGLSEFSHDIIPLANERFMLITTSYIGYGAYGFHAKPLNLFCVDGTTGNSLWVKSYGDTTYSPLNALYKSHIAFADSTYIIPTGNGSLMKINQLGDTLGFKNYKYQSDSYRSFNGVVTGHFGGLAMYGSSSQNAWIVQTDCILNDSSALNPVQQNCCRFSYDVRISYDTNKIHLCEGDSIVLTAHPNSANYLWSDGSTSQSISITQQGNYSVTVTNSNCANSVAPVYITVDSLSLPSINYNLNKQTICNGDSVLLMAFPNNVNYMWSNGSTSQSISVMLEGNYSVTVTNGGCAIPVMPVYISVDSLLIPVITKQDSILICNYSNGVQWYKDSILIAGATNQTYNTQGIEGNYRVAVSNVCGTAYSNEIIVVGIKILNIDGTSVRLFPNPLTGAELRVLGAENIDKIEFYNLLGEKMLESKNVSKLDVSSLPKGLYMVHLTGTKGNIVRKVRIE